MGCCCWRRWLLLALVAGGAGGAHAFAGLDLGLGPALSQGLGMGLDLLLLPLRVLEAVTEHFRQGGRYPEKHVRPVPPHKVASMSPFDFVVVGGGVAGSALAARLSERPDWTVLLLEAGGDENVLTDVPVLAATWQSTPFNWGYRIRRQPDACLSMKGQRCNWPRGKVLGGTSVLNYMIHTRGHRLDYDEWRALGNEGWGYDDVLPYFARTERVLVPGLAAASPAARGSDGPVNVEAVPFVTPLARAFVRAGRELGAREVRDYNAEGPVGFALLQATMRNGSRCSANKAYLRPAARRPNLFIASWARVTRVLIDPETKHASGVEFASGHSRWKAFAKKEVILSAGVFNSAQLLMLSGVGPKEHLQQLGIPVLADLKVGYNLMEHYGYLGTTFVVNQSVSVRVDTVLENPLNIPNYIFKGRGPLTVAGGAEALGYVRSNYSVDERPDIELLFVGATLAADAGTAVPKGLGLSRADYNAYFGPLTFRDGFTIWPLVMRPRGRGRVTLSSRDPFAPPVLDGRIFSHPLDMQVLVEGIKAAVRVGQARAFEAFGARLHTVRVPGCAREAFASDAYWECAARRLTAVLHHTCGTCKMGPDADPDAVVDAQLRVRGGVTGLRVVDASVMPTVPTAHTTAPTYMLAEKAADMIKQTWGRR